MEAHDSDVIVIGGGIIGTSVTERLTRAGLRVTLVEAREGLGLEATAAAIGGITPQSDEFCLGPLGRIAELSRITYQQWLAALGDESGVQVEVLDTGQIQVALQEEEMHRLDTQIAPAWHERGWDVHRMSTPELVAREPLLSGKVLGGYLLRAEFALEPRVVMRALTSVLARRHLAAIRCGSAVAALDSTEAGCKVVLTNGSMFSSRYIVLATGKFAEDFMDIPKGTLFPVKGQAIELISPEPHGYALTYHCYAKIKDNNGARSSYFVPRSDGRVVAGVTYEIGRDDHKPTREAYEQIMRGIADLLPSALTWPQSSHWAGVRPGVVDGIPIIGADSEHPNLIYCVGHYGLGVTLAPITAQLVGGIISPDLWPGSPDQLTMATETCSPSRFRVGVPQ